MLFDWQLPCCVTFQSGIDRRHRGQQAVLLRLFAIHVHGSMGTIVFAMRAVLYLAVTILAILLGQESVHDRTLLLRHSTLRGPSNL